GGRRGGEGARGGSCGGWRAIASWSAARSPRFWRTSPRRELINSPPTPGGYSSLRRAAGGDASGAAGSSQRQPGGPQGTGHRRARRGATRPGLEGERPLVEQHQAAVERRAPGARRRGEERRRATGVDEVDEQALGRGCGVAYAEPWPGEPERRRVHDQPHAREDVARRERGERDDGRLDWASAPHER